MLCSLRIFRNLIFSDMAQLKYGRHFNSQYLWCFNFNVYLNSCSARPNRTRLNVVRTVGLALQVDGTVSPVVGLGYTMIFVLYFNISKKSGNRAIDTSLQVSLRSYCH